MELAAVGEGRDKDKQEVGQQQQRPPPLPAPSSAFSFISHNIDLVGASALPASQPPTRPEVRGRRRDMGTVGKPQPGDFTCEMWHCCVEKLRSESFLQLRGKTAFGPAASNNTGLHGTKGTKDRKLAAAFTPGHTGRCENFTVYTGTKTAARQSENQSATSKSSPSDDGSARSVHQVAPCRQREINNSPR